MYYTYIDTNQLYSTANRSVTVVCTGITGGFSISYSDWFTRVWTSIYN